MVHINTVAKTCFVIAMETSTATTAMITLQIHFLDTHPESVESALMLLTKDTSLVPMKSGGIYPRTLVQQI